MGIKHKLVTFERDLDGWWRYEIERPDGSVIRCKTDGCIEEERLREDIDIIINRLDGNLISRALNRYKATRNSRVT